MKTCRTFDASWMVLTTHHYREDFAVSNLIRQKYDAYCPMIVKRVKHARRTSDLKRPLFPGYIFVKRPAQRHLYRPLLGTFGVRSVISHGDTPSLLPAGFVESLKAHEMDGVIQKQEMPFSVGQAVTISGGPFNGLVGQILEIRESERILLLLDLLNQQIRVHVKS